MAKTKKNKLTEDRRDEIRKFLDANQDGFRKTKLTLSQVVRLVQAAFPRWTITRTNVRTLMRSDLKYRFSDPNGAQEWIPPGSPRIVAPKADDSTLFDTPDVGPAPKRRDRFDDLDRSLDVLIQAHNQGSAKIQGKIRAHGDQLRKISDLLEAVVAEKSDQIQQVQEKTIRTQTAIIEQASRIDQIDNLRQVQVDRISQEIQVQRKSLSELWELVKQLLPRIQALEKYVAEVEETDVPDPIALKDETKDPNVRTPPMFGASAG